jgi:hypothetical protein
VVYGALVDVATVTRPAVALRMCAISSVATPDGAVVEAAIVAVPEPAEKFIVAV